MLRSMREGVKGPAGKVLLGIIIVPFVFIGGMELFTGDNEDSVLSVDGEAVSRNEFAQEFNTVRNEVASRMGDNVNHDLLTEERLTPMVIERLTQRKLLQQLGSAGKMELPVSSVNQTIVESEQFHVDGKFSEERYRQVLSLSYMTETGLRSSIEEYIRAGQLQNGLLRSGFGVDSQGALLKAVVSERRNVNLVKLTVASNSADINISEEELQLRYEDTKSQYMTELLVDAEYLVLDIRDLYEPVSEAALLEEYELEKSLFESVERRNVSHILLEASDDSGSDEIKQELLTIKARIEAGEAFASLAKEFSQDTGSAGDGGSLGFIEQDETFPESFENAAFSLGINEVSSVIETDSGFHLITVSEIERDEIESFDERKSFIEQVLQKRAASKEFVNKLEQLAEETFNAADLKGPAEILGLTLKSQASLARNGVSETVDDVEVFSNASVLTALFSDELLIQGLNSEPIEIGDSKAVVVRTAASYEPRQKTLDEVRARLIAELKLEAVQTRLQEKVKTLVGNVNESTTFAEASAALDLEPKLDLALTRNSKEVDTSLLQELFRLPRSSTGTDVQQFVAATGDHYAYQFLEVGSTEIPELSDELLAQQLDQLNGQSVMAAFMANLKSNAEIEQKL